MSFGDVLYPSLCAVLTQILYLDVRRAQGWRIYTHQRGVLDVACSTGKVLRRPDAQNG